jgi:hypothetical protein
MYDIIINELGWDKERLATRMQSKQCSLKSTNQQVFSTQNYVALSFTSHQEICKSKTQRLIKHINKKLTFSPL